MMTQVLTTFTVSEELLVALQRLSPAQYQQVVDFARFLAQRSSTDEKIVEEDTAPSNWVEKASGSMKNIPEFDTVVAYGRAIRLDGAVTIESVEF
jgi:hypothetical protein